ncbi:MAG TPA: D-alanyl-D-alanine carboxypeptidase family protein [Actinomycetota bacterium]
MKRRVAAGAAAFLPLVLLIAQASWLHAIGAPAAPPPTPVPPNGSPSPFVSRLSTPVDPVPVPRIDAPAVVLMDLAAGQILYQRAAVTARPIASLTKLMTALLVLEAEEGRLDRTVRVDPEAVFARGEYGVGSSLGLRPGERVSVRGLLAGLLLGSANDAAEALAIEESGSVGAFVAAMNARARALGMAETAFASPHGLDDRGLSSAFDILTLLREVRRHTAFRRLVASRVVVVRSDAAPPRRIQNRNVMLWLYPGASGVKTGSTAGAGYCLVATAQRGGRELAAVVLGGRDEVFSEAAALLNHGFAAYHVRTLVSEGAQLGSVRVRGGTVPVVAGEELEALVREQDTGAVERIVTASRSVAYPPASGSEVGTLRVTSGGTLLGQVPLLVADLPPPEEPGGSWWGRAVGAVSSALGSVIADLMD